MRNANKQKGFSLVETLMALAVIGLLILMFSKLENQMSDARSQIELRSDVMSLRNLLARKVDCTKTVDPTNMAACDSSLMTLLDRSGNPILTSTGKTFGRITLRAFCNPASSSLVIEGALLKPGGSVNSTLASHFLRDPLTSEPLNWSHRALKVIPREFRLCTDKLNPGGGGGGPVTTLPIVNMGGALLGANCTSGSISGHSSPCPVGEKVIGGGAVCYSNGSSNPELNTSAPDLHNNRWTATCCDADKIVVNSICSP